MTLDYTQMRQFADSWGLLFMALFFVGVIVWVMLPGSRRASEEAARIPFGEDE